MGRPGAGATAKGARMQAERPQRVPNRFGEGCVYRWAAAWFGPISFHSVAVSGGVSGRSLQRCQLERTITDESGRR